MRLRLKRAHASATAANIDTTHAHERDRETRVSAAAGRANIPPEGYRSFARQSGEWLDELESQRTISTGAVALGGSARARDPPAVTRDRVGRGSRDRKRPRRSHQWRTALVARRRCHRSGRLLGATRYLGRGVTLRPPFGRFPPLSSGVASAVVCRHEKTSGQRCSPALGDSRSFAACRVVPAVVCSERSSCHGSPSRGCRTLFRRRSEHS